jgi:hypothetical protein
MYIVHQVTGEKVECEILKAEDRNFHFIKKNFHFDWYKEFLRMDVFILTTSERNFIHGLILLLDGEDYLVLKLIELHQENIGSNKWYDRIAGNLIAFAAVIALQKFNGFMMAESKSMLIDHYCSTYGFQRIGNSNRLISLPDNSKKLVDLYYVN